MRGRPVGRPRQHQAAASLHLGAGNVQPPLDGVRRLRARLCKGAEDEGRNARGEWHEKVDLHLRGELLGVEAVQEGAHRLASADVQQRQLLVRERKAEHLVRGGVVTERGQ
jgi:hypothetical protein